MTVWKSTGILKYDVEVGAGFGLSRFLAPFQTKKRFFEAIYLNFSENRDRILKKAPIPWKTDNPTFKFLFGNVSRVIFQNSHAQLQVRVNYE
jgi:hypothetical protein